MSHASRILEQLKDAKEEGIIDEEKMEEHREKYGQESE